MRNEKTLTGTITGTFLMTVAVLGVAACDRTDNGVPATSTSPRAADNTARNDVDRGGARTTPIDQSENADDVQITADIRRAIMEDDAMSMNADNAKIMTSNGHVTLEGVVASQAEKDAVGAKAKAAAGVLSVTNNLTIKP
ncbi:MAG: BON domain-containing protein [Phycisphaerae bacterium]|nr:BON domain-containing protein [Phycisphaerae bacterium]